MWEDMMSRFARLVVGALFAGMAAAVPFSQATADFPERTMTLVIPFAPGGGADRWSRLLASEAESHFGVAWQPANVTGAQGTTGWQHLLDEPADGHTLIFGSGTMNLSLALNPTPAVNHDQIKIVTIVSQFQSVLLTEPDQPWSTWEGLVEYAKENPNKLTIGGSLGNIVSLASLVDQAGIEVRLVPYPGAGAATTDFLGGHIQAMGVPPSVADKLVPEEAAAVIVASDEPVEAEQFKDLPTAKDVGLEGMAIPRWIGIHPDTPDDIVAAVAEGMESLLKDPKITGPLESAGEAVFFTPTEKAQQQYNRMVEQLESAAKLIQ